MDYKEKYLKYKSKYFTLKNQQGGLNFFKSKQQLEKERLEKERLEKEILEKQQLYIEQVKLREEKLRQEQEKLMQEQIKNNNLIKEYEKLGYKHIPYKRARLNIVTVRDNEHVEWIYVKPHNIKQRIYKQDWEKELVGLEEKIKSFRPIYDKFIKAGYSYETSTESSYDYNRNIELPATAAYFEYVTDTSTRAYSHIKGDRNSWNIAMPPIESWEKNEPPSGNGWIKIFEEKPEWDGQNGKWDMVIRWRRNVPTNLKKIIYENEWNEELKKII